MVFNSLHHKTVLITGGTGFLGSNLLKELTKTNTTLIALKRTSSTLFRLASIQEQIIFYNIDVTPLETIFENHHIDFIIHCATSYGSELKNIQELIESNLVLPLQLLKQSINHNKPVFINTDTILDRRVSAYSLAKKQFLDWLTLFSDEMACINISLEHFYGPLDNRSKFCSKVIIDLLTEKKEINLTKGLQTRDFIYIDDVVSAFMQILDFSMNIQKGFYHFEVGTGINISIKQFVELIKTLIGNTTTKLNFGSLDYRPNETMESHVDLQPLVSLGWKPNFSLIDGLTKTINVEKNYLKETA